MARRLDPGQAKLRQPSSDRIYPWDEWFDGTPWELTTDDFDGRLDTFRARCYYRARESGYRLSTRVKNGKLYLRAYAWDGSELGPLDEFGRPVSPQPL